MVLNSVYKGRKKITDEQIDKITYSEGNHMTLDADQALAVGIEKEKVNSILPADASYHINDNK
ncbi:hypothetical protein PUG81_28130 [Erwiniaceae bacterium L1_54_6]|nr:hypothetical protein [Erwiniaceae bacterium L1_54_6]